MKNHDYINNWKSSHLEERFLASILCRNDAILDIIDIISVDMFESNVNSNIYHCMISLFENKCMFDEIILFDKLEQEGFLAKTPNISTGDIKEYVYNTLKNAEVTAIKIAEYAKHIKKRYKIRYGINKHKEAIEKIYVCNDESLVDEISQNTALEISSITENKNNTIQKIGLDTKQLLTDINYKLNIDTIEVSGKKTGWHAIDIALDGLHPGCVYNFTGPSRSGKSTWQRQCMLYRAKENNLKKIEDSPVLCFSSEETKQKMDIYLISQSMNISRKYIIQPKLYFIENGIEQTTENIYKFLNDIKYHSELVKGLNILIDESPCIELSSLIAKAKKTKLQYGKIDSIFVDHTNIVRVAGANDIQRVPEIYMRLKALAKDLNVPIVPLHQMNNSIKESEDRRPSEFNLKWGGIIENCDAVMLLYRPSIYNDLIIKRPDLKDVCEIIFEKIRDGEQRDPLSMLFNGTNFHESKF